MHLFAYASSQNQRTPILKVFGETSLSAVHSRPMQEAKQCMVPRTWNGQQENIVILEGAPKPGLASYMVLEWKVCPSLNERIFSCTQISGRDRLCTKTKYANIHNQ